MWIGRETEQASTPSVMHPGLDTVPKVEERSEGENTHLVLFKFYKKPM